MTTRLRSAREQPLLKAPNTEKQWWEPTPEEEDRMRAGLEEFRKAKNPPLLAEIIYCMEKLKLLDEVRPSDVVKFKVGLNVNRSHANGFEVAALHYFMHELGVGEEVTTRDEDMIKWALADKTQQNIGHEVARLHYYMNKLGVKHTLDPYMIDSMIDRRDYFTRERRGLHLPEIFYYMGYAGLIGEPTDEDKQAVKNSLKRSNYYHKPLMYHYLNQILPEAKQKPTQKEQGMPPLKKFVK